MNLPSGNQLLSARLFSWIPSSLRCAVQGGRKLQGNPACDAARLAGTGRPAPPPVPPLLSLVGFRY